MKPTPNELAILAHEIARVYGTLEEWMIRRIVQRLMDGAPDLPAEVEDWRIEKILASASFRRESVAVMRKVLGDIPPQVDRMLYHTARESVDGGDGATLQEAWERGLIRNMPQPEMAAKTTFMIEKLKEQALDRMNLVNTSMLTSAQQKYINTLNVAAGFMLSGESPHVAMKTATRQLVKDGLTGFYDRAGRQWEPQSAVEMILRTTGNSAANQAAFTRMDEVGCDVIVVSSHLGARPKCSLVQGKLFSRSGTTKTVKDKHGAVWQVGDWNKTSYGEPDGILGINCRHHIGMFFDGLSENKQEQIDETKNRERYEQEQKQRKLERELRKAKRERDVAKEIGDEDGARLANRKARAKSKELRDHIAEFDLRRSKVRERYQVSAASLLEHSSRSIVQRDMASGMRRSIHTPLTVEEIESIKHDVEAIKADQRVFVFAQNSNTGYLDAEDLIIVGSNVFPSLDDSLHPRDRMSTRAVLAHEYYGHRAYRNSPLPRGSWQDEFRASYMAAKNAPGLIREDRVYLIQDALYRAKEQGVTIRWNKFIREVLHGK